MRAYRESLELARDRCAAGLDSDEAIAQAETQLKATQAQDTNLAVPRAQYEHAIAVLAGQPASEFSIPVGAVRPTAPPTIPAGFRLNDWSGALVHCRRGARSCAGECPDRYGQGRFLSHRHA